MGLFFLTALLPLIQSVVPCSLPILGPNLNAKCSYWGERVECGSSVIPGTKLYFNCSPFYKLEDRQHSESHCQEDGVWSNKVPRCIPECGKLATALPLVVHGTIASGGRIPWQVILYHRGGGGWEFWCGGSLISARLVVTAAHCAWQVEPQNLLIGFGKVCSNISAPEMASSQIIQVAALDMLQSYQDVNGNYNGDLSVLTLARPVQFTGTISPICIDWQQQFVDEQIQEGNTGVAAGWGLTENETFSAELRAIRMPVQSDAHCIEREQMDFRKYVTYTSFCAGYNNGSGVCNGDSGGGLSFLDAATDTWYLQGVISVSPRKLGTPYCDPSYYTVFTKVAMFTKWLKMMMEKEETLSKRNEELKLTRLPIALKKARNIPFY